VTTHEIFEAMRDRLVANPGKVANLKATYQFEVTGEGGGLYHAVFDNGSMDIGEGPTATPGCSVTIAAEDFQNLVVGKANATALFMSGKLKIKGDMGLAMKLQTVLG
jgi:putative sterol carrier protein